MSKNKKWFKDAITITHERVLRVHEKQSLDSTNSTNKNLHFPIIKTAKPTTRIE